MKKNKTILFVSTGLGLGGVAKMVHHISGVLAKDYQKVVAVTTSNNLVVQNNGVEYLEPLYEQKRGLKGYYRTIKAIRNVIKKVKPDAVISFTTNISFCTRVATLDMKDLIVISAERGDPYSLGLKWKYPVRWAFKHSDWCFFQLEHARDFYSPTVIEKSFVIPNAAFYDGPIGIHKGIKKTITSVGRFVEEKGYKYLIEAFKIVHQKYPEYALVIYGEGPLKEEYEKQVESLGLKRYVSFPGRVSDISQTLKDEGIFVLPSLLEGIPNVLIEALMVGIPTVSCDCNPGGPRFLTANGERGLLFPVGDVKGIVQCISRLIEDKQLYTKFEKEGPKVIDMLKPEQIEPLWVEAFNKILG